MSEKLKILFVEDSKSDLEFIQQELELGGIDFIPEVVETAQAFENALQSFRPDIILADYNLPAFNGIKAFKKKQEISPLIPFILISGSIGEEKSVDLIKDGMTDCVQKDKLFTLPVKVNRALKELHEQLQKIKMKEKLVESERLLSRAQKLTHMGSWEVNMKTGTSTWSNEMYAIYEYDPDSSVPKEEVALDMVHPADKEVFINWIRSLRTGIRKSSVVFRIIRKNSGVRYLNVEGEIIVNESGEATYIFGTTQDITEKKIAEEIILESEAKYKAIVDTTDEMIHQLSMEGEIIWVNEAWKKNMNVSAGEVTGKKITDFFDDATKVKFSNVFQKLIKGEKVQNLSCSFINKNNKTIFIEGEAHPLIKNGKVIGSQAFLKNVTERKKSEEILKKTLEELNNRYNELMQFNYIVSHNLRAPVANIIGLSGLLKIQDIDPDEKDKIIDHISSSVVKMDEMIKDLNLILSSRSALNAEKNVVNIPAVIYSICETLENQIIESGINIKTSIPDNAREIFSIKGYIESILYNLISNAVKYKSTKVIPEIGISTEIRNEMLVLTISDNGIGIDLKKHGEYVFGLYKRFHFEKEGKGLGLYMTKTQVESLRGNISVQSKTDQGTIFTVKLPIQ